MRLPMIAVEAGEHVRSDRADEKMGSWPLWSFDAQTGTYSVPLA
jgi:hypothetical protein